MSRSNWIGETLNGRYQLEEKLGQGGMAAVYRATDPNLRRVVAVKLIHPHLTDAPEFVRRFEEEAAAVAQLRHPNIVQVFDFDHDDDVYFIVFEFVPGESLQARQQRYLDSGREMPLDQTVDIIAKVADALEYAHKRNLVHRDVKPANVMINVHGEPILMDFGIVKIAGGTQHTATGAVLGTARYMAPEQIRGERVDARTDIYALGAMLYEMVSGRPPFDANSAMTVMMMHVSDPVPDVRDFRPNLPPSLVAIINRALAKNPADRYQTVGAMAAALRAADLSAAPPPVAADQTYIEAAPVGAARTFISGAQSAETVPPPPVQRQPAAPAAQPTPAVPPSSNRLPLLIGGIALVLLLIVGGFVVGPRLFGGGADGDEPTPALAAAAGDSAGSEGAAAAVDATATPSNAAAALEPEPTETDAPDPTLTPEPTVTPAATATATTAPTNTPVPSPTPQPTNTPAPTATPQPTAIPAPTQTPLPDLFAQINSITISGDNYVVDYQTFGYTAQVPGQHIHFFYNTVAPDQAGVPGSGPWILYGGPNPFTQYTVSGRPGGATAMCALVANPDHSVIQGTGNCVALP